MLLGLIIRRTPGKQCRSRSSFLRKCHQSPVPSSISLTNTDTRYKVYYISSITYLLYIYIRSWWNISLNDSRSVYLRFKPFNLLSPD
jgi:hypothetical protein